MSLLYMWVCIAITLPQHILAQGCPQLSTMKTKTASQAGRAASKISKTKLAILLKENIVSFDDDAWRSVDEEYVVKTYSKFFKK